MIPNLTQAENYILTASKGGDRSKIQAIRNALQAYKVQIDYNMTRFIDQFGPKLDDENHDKYHRFVKIQNEEYAKITRLNRVMDAYKV